MTLMFCSASSSCLLNGIPGPSFKHGKGLRQGDSLSPLLFIMAIDPLHRLLEAAGDQGLLDPLPGRGMDFRISLYADNAVIFANPIKEEVDNLLQLLISFGQATGLKLNQEKSMVIPINYDEVSLPDVLHEFKGQTAAFLTTYLGLPLSLRKLRLVQL